MIATVPKVLVGSRATAQLELTPLARSHAGATDYWDGNWLDTRVAVRAGAFRGEFVATLRTEEFAAFASDLRTASHELRGAVAFRSLEEWVVLEVHGDGRGHFTGVCRVRDRAGDGNLLECEIQFDQTEIPMMLGQLAAVAETFPTIGSPEAAG